MLSITWLGHSTFILGLPTGKRVLVDPWLTNPNCPEEFSKPDSLKPIDLILVTHGHGDHSSDAAAVARANNNAPIVCIFELGIHLKEKGLLNVHDMGIGGTQELAGIKVTMTYATHSGSVIDGGRIVYSGGAAGYILRAPKTPTIYFAGDTGLFGDMKIIGEIYKPEIAFLPMGDHYTMGPDTAAIAAEWLGARQVVPMHWGTFPLLSGTPDALKKALAHRGAKAGGIDVLDIRPGETAK